MVGMGTAGMAMGGMAMDGVGEALASASLWAASVLVLDHAMCMAVIRTTVIPITDPTTTATGLITATAIGIGIMAPIGATVGESLAAFIGDGINSVYGGTHVEVFLLVESCSREVGEIIGGIA